MEFEADALVFTMLGSIVAYTVNGFFVGFRPLFDVPSKLAAPGSADYGWYVVLGVACGVVATILPVVFYTVRDLFRLIPWPAHIKPAIGGLGVGLAALLLPQLLGGGYDWIQAAIDGRMAGTLMLFLCFGKILTFALTIGSGGSGGVFAPSLFTGAMLGGFLGQVFHQPPAAFAVVGMAAVFGGAARVPDCHAADGHGNDRRLPLAGSRGSGRHAQLVGPESAVGVPEIQEPLRGASSQPPVFTLPLYRTVAHCR